MMNKSFIVQEGYKPIFISLAVAFLLYLINCEFLGTIGFLLTLSLVYIYRDTARYIYENSSNILAPIDGKVIAIDHRKHSTKIYVEVCLLNNHNIRSPFHCAAKIKSEQHGLNLDPSTFKGSLLNEQVKIKFTSSDFDNKNIKLKLIGGFFNLSMNLNLKESYNQSENLGLFINDIADITL